MPLSGRQWQVPLVRQWSRASRRLRRRPKPLTEHRGTVRKTGTTVHTDGSPATARRSRRQMPAAAQRSSLRLRTSAQARPTDATNTRDHTPQRRRPPRRGGRNVDKALAVKPARVLAVQVQHTHPPRVTRGRHSERPRPVHHPRSPVLKGQTGEIHQHCDTATAA
jgi:hypothetical protein